MDKEALTAAMKTSISDVLETMFFLPLDVYDTASPEELRIFETEGIMACKLTFSGPFSGRFVFWAPNESALSLTANFLGMDQSGISKDQITETVKEIINMIAGNTFSIFNPQVVFNLDIPQMIQFEDPCMDHSGSEEEAFIVITTLEDRLALQMVIE